MKESSKIMEKKECFVCMNMTDDMKVLVCSHEMCGVCYRKWEVSCVSEGVDVTCPCCRKVLVKRPEGPRRVHDTVYIPEFEEDDNDIYFHDREGTAFDLVNGPNNTPTWRELLAAQQGDDQQGEIIDPNDDLIAYNEVYNSQSDSEESDIDYPDEDYDW